MGCLEEADVINSCLGKMHHLPFEGLLQCSCQASRKVEVGIERDLQVPSRHTLDAPKHKLHLLADSYMVVEVAVIAFLQDCTKGSIQLVTLGHFAHHPSVLRGSTF